MTCVACNSVIPLRGIARVAHNHEGSVSYPLGSNLVLLCFLSGEAIHLGQGRTLGAAFSETSCTSCVCQQLWQGSQ